MRMRPRRRRWSSPTTSSRPRRRAQQVCGGHVERDATDVAQRELDRVRHAPAARAPPTASSTRANSRRRPRAARRSAASGSRRPVGQHVDRDRERPTAPARRKERAPPTDSCSGPTRASGATSSKGGRTRAAPARRARRAATRKKPATSAGLSRRCRHGSRRSTTGTSRSRRCRSAPAAASILAARALHGTHPVRPRAPAALRPQATRDRQTVSAAGDDHGGGVLAFAWGTRSRSTTRRWTTTPAVSPPALGRARPEVVVIYDDVFNWFTKMCLGRMREAALEMIRRPAPRARASSCRGTTPPTRRRSIWTPAPTSSSSARRRSPWASCWRAAIERCAIAPAAPSAAPRRRR